MTALNGGSFDVVARQGLAIVVLLVLAAGFAFGYLPRSHLPRALLMPIAGLGALALLTAFSLGWAPSAEHSLAELARIVQLGSVIALAWLLLNRYTWTAAIGGATAGALLIVVLAVLSRLSPDLLGTDEIVQSLGTTRLSYPLDYWNAVGSWGAMRVVMALAWSAHARTPWVRAAALALVPVAGLAIYFTFSRWSLVALLVGVGVVVVASHNRWTLGINLAVASAGTAIAIAVARSQDEIYAGIGADGSGVVFATLALVGVICAAVAAIGALGGADRLRVPRAAARGSAALAASAVVALAGVALATGVVDEAWDEFTAGRGAGGQTDPESRLLSLGGTRSTVYEAAIDAFESEPLRGIGPGGFAAYWRQNGEGREAVVDAHSLYLEQLGELGIPGLLAVLVFLGALGWLVLAARLKAETPRRAGAAAAAAAAFAVYSVHAGADWIWEYPALGILGLGSAAVAAMELGSAQSAPLRAGRLRVAAIALIGAVALVQAPGYFSTLAERSSDDLLAGGDLAAALDEADTAVAWAPWAGTPRAQRGVVQEARGELAAASKSYREAIKRDPGEWRYQIQLARTEAMRGNLRSAVRAMSSARRLNPRSIVADEEIARLRGLLVTAAP